jgi:protein-disulfide isomerase
MAKQSARESRTERAAAAMEVQRRRERRRATLMILGVVLVLLVVVVGGFLVNRARDTSSNVSAPAAGTGNYGVAIGDKNAPHTVVIYEDFLCPYCGELEKRTRDDLAQLADDGKVQVEYRPFNLLGDGEKSYSYRSAGAFSIVLDKSTPEVAKKFHDLLFENQPDESGPFPKSAELADLAVEAGADESAVRSAIEGDEGADWVTTATAAAQKAGVQSTPTILLNGEVFQSGTTIDDLANDLIAKLQ